jgi:hypothetical protein
MKTRARGKPFRKKQPMTILSEPVGAQAPGTSGITLTAKTVGDLHGRLLTGVALDQASQRFTPVALAIATRMNIEFDISWQAEAWSYVVGDNR